MSGSNASVPNEVTLIAGAKSVTLPVLSGTLGNPCIDIGKQVWVLVSRAAQHDPIHYFKLPLGFIQRRHATIEDDSQCWKVALESMHCFVTERLDFAVVLRTQAL